MSIRHLDRLLNPSSVAVYGASTRPNSVGATIWRNLRAGGFAGALYPVNPKHAALDGVTAYARTADLPAVPDLAVICTPPDTVAPLVAELGAFGTRAAIVVTAGLTKDQKQAVLDAARPHTLRLLGNNCIGSMSPRIGLNATFAHADALPGQIAFVSQSGALVTAVLDWAKARGIGFSHMVSLGEHIDVDFGDLLDHLATDAATRAILLYVESVSAPRKFMSAARSAARNKPVIVVKAGRTAHGVKAAASHTGALAGSDTVYDAAIRRAGLLRVDTLQELFTAAQTLARFAGNRSEALTILTNGGGAGVMAADAAEREGVELAEPSAELLATLDAALPFNWSRANPIDIIGDAPVERYTAALAALLATPDSGALLFVHAPTAIVRSDDIARACVPLLRAAPSRVMGCWLGDGAVSEARRLFEAAGVPDYPTPEEAVHAFSMLQTFRRNQATLLETPSASENPLPDVAAARAHLDRALAEGRAWLSEAEAKAVLAAYGIPVVPTVLTAPTPEAAVAAAKSMQWPLALKIVSPEITHKSDVGGVRLGLEDEAALADAAVQMLQRVQRARPDARLTGFTVQSMVHRSGAYELIVGASVDAVFGPVILCGEGGTAVEVTADSAIALPPLNRSLARELVSRTRISRRLAGYRDRPPVKADALHDVLIAVSQMLADLPHLAELDINPLWVDEKGVLALDARIRVSPTPVAGAANFAIRPYPARWVKTMQWENQRVTVRPIRPEDEGQHRRFLEQLAPEDVRMRVFYTRRELPHSELARLTQIDYDREMAFIAEVPGADGPQTLGVARAVSDPDNTEAEFAVIVRSDLKARGLGTLLMATLEDYLRQRGTQRLFGQVLRENAAMLQLARSEGYTVEEARESDPDIRVVTKSLV